MGDQDEEAVQVIVKNTFIHIKEATPPRKRIPNAQYWVSPHSEPRNLKTGEGWAAMDSDAAEQSAICTPSSTGERPVARPICLNEILFPSEPLALDGEAGRSEQNRLAVV